MAPVSIFSTAPTTPVNKGLAAEVKPLYPEQIGILQQHNKDKKFKEAQDRAIKAQNYEWLEKKAIDPEGMSDYEVQALGKQMKDISARFSADVDASKDPMITKAQYRKELNEVSTKAQQYRISGSVESSIAMGLKKGGVHYDRLDKAKTYARMSEIRRDAEAKGIVPDFSEVVDNPELLSLAKTGKAFNESLELQYEQELRAMDSEGSDEDFQALTKYISGNIWQRNADGSYKYNPNTDQRMVKPKATPEFLERVRSNTDYYNALKVEAKRQGMPVSELAYQRFLQTNDVSEIEKLVRTTNTTKPTAEVTKKTDAMNLVRQVAQGMQPGDPAGTAKTALAQLGGRGLKFSKDGPFVTATISKTFLDQLSQGNMVLLATKMGIDIGAAGEDEDALRELMSKEVRVGNSTIDIDLRDNFNSGVMEMIRLSGLAKGTGEVTAMGDYLGSIQGQTSEFYKDVKQYTFPGYDKDLQGNKLQSPTGGKTSLGLGQRN